MFISIKYKVFIIISAFLILVLVSLMFYDINKSKEELTQYFDNLNTSSGKLLNQSIKSDLYNLNFTNAKLTLSYYDNEYFENIYILNKDGYIFAERNSDKIVYKKYIDFDLLLTSSKIKPFEYVQTVSFINKTIGYIIIKNKSEVFEEIIEKEIDDILVISLVTMIILLIISSIISIIITKPIEVIIEGIKNLNEKNELSFKPRNDEYGFLINEIEQSHKKIQELNENLEERVREELQKNKDKDKMLQAQGLRASMGEMMDAIAHQWVQPLNFIGLKSQELSFRAEMEDTSSDVILSSCSDIDVQLEHLTSTLDEFRSFFRLNKKTENVLFKNLIEETLVLLKNDTIKNKIKVTTTCNQENKVNIIPNEFKHVLINLMSNSKDAFVEHKIIGRKIFIDVYDKDDEVILCVQDNAGGIPVDLIDDVFKSNISSKQVGKGTGIGLYMSKMIIEKIGGSIKVENKNNGACFIISLKSKING